MTLDAWSFLSTILFARCYPAKRSIYHHKARLPLPSPFDPLDAYTLPRLLGPAWSSVTFITHLTLESNSSLSTPQLLLLASIPALGLLRIVEPLETSLPLPRVTDRLIRGWVEQENPFPALRILQLSGCVDVTPECLRYLARFPVLTYATVRGRRSNWSWGSVYVEAPSHGWRVPEYPDDVQALMLRYFASCLGVREGLPRYLELAARLVSKGKPAGLSRLLSDSPLTEFGEKAAVLPWEGEIPQENDSPRAQMHEEDEEHMPLGTTVTIHDNPMWWLYTAIGHVILRNEDLNPMAAVGGNAPTSNGWALPPLPTLSLSNMGPREHRAVGIDEALLYADSYIPQEGIDDQRLVKYVFVREAAFNGVEEREEAWVPGLAPAQVERQDERAKPGPSREREAEATLRRRKKRRMGDLLSSMASG